MTVNRTTLLDLPLPVTGTESGTWGDITNNGLSEYIDISVAGSLSLSADSDTDLSSTEGDAAGTNIGSTTAQYAILRCTGARTATRNINAPAWAISGGTLTNYSKIYIVVNETTGSQNIVLRATDSATPTYTTGVTIVPGERAVCAWNGSDFVKVGGAAGGSTTQVQFNNAGVFGGISNATTDGTTLSMTSPKVITGINDTNGNELLKVTATASAVNELTLANAATGGNPVLSATGGDTNIGITLTPKGTGGVVFPAGAVGTPAITTTGDTNTGVFFPAADTIAFTEGGAEAMRIDSSGRLLVGTTTARSDFFNTTTVIPAFQVELASAANLNRFISVTSNNSDTGGANLFLAKSRGTTVGAVTIVQNDDQIGAISFQGADGVDMVQAAMISCHVDGTPGSNDMPGSLRFFTTADGAASSTERMRISADGTIKTSSTISVGNATPSTSGAGITFPATQSASSDANTLDDYEEGTFTPTARGATTAGTTTYTNQYGYYTKIGRSVTVVILVQWSAMTGTGILTIGGLPFASANNTQNYASGAVITSDLNWTGGTMMTAFQELNTTDITLVYSSDDGPVDRQQCVNESAQLRITVTYFA